MDALFGSGIRLRPRGRFSSKVMTALESRDRNNNILNPVSLRPEIRMRMRDTDGDGIPDLMDRDPYDPNIPIPMTKQRRNRRADRMLNSILGEDEDY